MLRKGEVRVNKSRCRPSQKLQIGDEVRIPPYSNEHKATKKAENNLKDKLINSIIFEDKKFIILNKPVGIASHGGSGISLGVIEAFRQIDKSYKEAQLVHRLDKDTSGIMVVAKTEFSYLNLVGQLKERTVKRDYLALVVGQPVSGGVINKPIGRHPKHRTKQAVVDSGKEAITDYKIKEKLHGYSLLLASLKTGRTHQIRVHFSSKDFPIVGDPLYGGKRKFAPGTSENLKKEILELNRQALHAYSLSFIHPVDQYIITNTAPMPNDMKKLINNLRQHV